MGLNPPTVADLANATASTAKRDIDKIADRLAEQGAEIIRLRGDLTALAKTYSDIIEDLKSRPSP